MKRRKRHTETAFEETGTAVNPYYESVSERYGVAQVLLYSVLLAFVVLSFLSNTGMITYENLYYFVKDLNASAENVDVIRTDSISYPADDSQSFALYRQGLAVAGKASVTVFTASGRQAVSETVQYRTPVAIGTGKYLLVYDLGGTQYSLYNSYTQIYTGKAESPIRVAAMSEGGMYAIVTESSQYASVVELFNSDFHRINRYHYNGYVTDVALQAKGSYLAVLVSDVQNGAFSTELRIYEPGTDRLFASSQLQMGLGLRCGFTESGDVAILCGNGISYVNNRGKLLAEQGFEGDSLAAFDLNANGCVAVLKKNQNSLENRVIVFDKVGKMLYNSIVYETVDGTAMGKNAFFLMTPDGITRILCADGAVAEIPYSTEQKVMLAVDDTRVLLCSSKQAVSCKFDP